MTAPIDWSDAMREAIDLALSRDVDPAGNPRVGCVILDADGRTIGRGCHRGAGTAHAEVNAIADAGELARGATAVVTLEPCRHTGRTGPCTDALIDAGIARVVYAVDDPGEHSSGGADVLRSAGIEVVGGVLVEEARWAARGWFSVQERHRPWVTLKSAVSLDGRVADAAGGPTRISGDQSRIYSHEWRARVDAIVVGTGTVLPDDPSLTARDVAGPPVSRQPLRVVVGESEIPSDAKVLDDAAPTMQFRGRDLTALVRELNERGVQHVLVEGGPTLAAAFLHAGLVDEVLWFVAPVLLGDGPVALPPLGRGLDVDVRRVRVLGEDVVIEGTIMEGADVHGHR